MPPDVYTAQDIAAAARVPERLVISLLARGEIRSVAAFAPAGGACRSGVLWVCAAAGSGPGRPGAQGGTAGRPAGRGRRTGAGAVRPQPGNRPPGHDAAGALDQPPRRDRRNDPPGREPECHGHADADRSSKDPDPVRLVFLTTPGPGGGGGGGGLRMKAPPPKAERKGESKISSPLPVRKLPPPLEVKPKVVGLHPRRSTRRRCARDGADCDQAGHQQDREGLMVKSEEPKPSSGPGVGGGVGSGQGTGLGPGDGSGIGDGSGGGTGGGPYRPGSGVAPPRLLKEVRALYSDQARRANLEGEVELES